MASAPACLQSSSTYLFVNLYHKSRSHRQPGDLSSVPQSAFLQIRVPACRSKNPLGHTTLSGFRPNNTHSRYQIADQGCDSQSLFPILCFHARTDECYLFLFHHLTLARNPLESLTRWLLLCTSSAQKERGVYGLSAWTVYFSYSYS